MKKLLLIGVIAAIVAAGFVGCRKDNKETKTLVYVFERENIDIIPLLVIEVEDSTFVLEADSVHIDTTYKVFEFTDFLYDGEIRDGVFLNGYKGVAFVTFMDTLYTVESDYHSLHEIKYSITDSLFCFSFVEYDFLTYDYKIIANTTSSFTIENEERIEKYNLSQIKKPD